MNSLHNDQYQQFIEELVELGTNDKITIDQSERLARLARLSLLEAQQALDLTFYINRRVEELLERQEIAEKMGDKLMGSEPISAMYELFICEGIGRKIRELLGAQIITEDDVNMILDIPNVKEARRALFELDGVTDFYRAKYAATGCEPLSATGTDGE
ncbi:MAG TPA: hypothetical protein PKA32_01275 [Candidatus Gracilibacteria bacterium]|nr:hypothetical protein [Candidatus Gracilibacteria bacterium]